ncbi:hypothetical protein DBR47_13300 [Paucibacter sp. KBW04]|uniref:acyltransferase family protein n=1 Tax=Paucibacter sp. KBW04 TaxID=2153361 RepID=UPI000F57C7CB|nr:acyltransferase family protein [Paucibacter sp. KBW04]RQO58660.1 hypothetical protein DBR47_13300 [Paucibacter sp. KBW04]
MQHKEWVDKAKGVGIVCVVAGHVLSPGPATRAIYLWHMPLFFVLSGYLFSPRPLLAYARQKALHLLLPYASFLLLFSLPALLQGQYWQLWKMAYGGRALTGSWGTFWFVPILFLTQQTANLLIQKWTQAGLAVAALACLLVANFLPQGLGLPWALDVLLFAFPLFCMGYRCKGREPQSLWISALGLLGLLLSAAGLLPSLDLKQGDYGWPLLSLVFSLAAVHLVCQLCGLRSLTLGRFDVLASLGRASMTLMFVHPALFRYLRDDLHLISNQGLLMLCALLGPWLLHQLLSRWAFTRRLFLGDWHGKSRPA